MVAILLAIWQFLVVLGPFLISLIEVLGSLVLALWELAKIATIAYAFYIGWELLFDPKGKERVGNFLGNIVHGTFVVVGPVLSALTPALQDVVSAFATAFQTTGPGLADSVAEPIGQFASSNFNSTIAALSGIAESTADNSVTQASAAIKDAFSKGLSATAVAASFESLFPEKLNTLNGVAPLLGQMAGFADVSAAIREPLYRAAFGRSAEYKFNEQFTPNLLDAGHATEWLARRIIGEAEFDTLYDATGLKGEYEANYTQAAYRPISPRLLTNLLVDQPFNTAQIQAMLEDAGISPTNIGVLLPAYEYNSVKTLRMQYVGTLLRSAELGSVSESELQSDLNSLGWSATAVNFALLTVAQKRLDSLLTIYRNEIYSLYSTSQLTLAQVEPALVAAGYDPQLAEAYTALWSAKVIGKELAAAARAEAKLAAKETSLALSTAKSLYLAGTIDAVAMAAAVTASGLDLNLVPLTVSLYTAELSAKRVDAYGVLLPRNQALLLRQQVSALQAQVKAQFVSPTDALTALAALGIGAGSAQALVAQWAATITPAADRGVSLPR